MKISVIVPAHNEERYLEKTLRNLNRKNVELIVVCDSCDDKSYEVAKKHSKNVYSVRFENVSKVRNFGAKKARGEILIFNDADTLVSENYFEEIEKNLKKFDYGFASWKSEKGSLLGRYVAWTNNKYNNSNRTVNGNFFVRKKVFDSVGGFDEKMLKGEDTDIGERLREKKFKFVFLENCFQIPSERRYRERGFLVKIISDFIGASFYRLYRKEYLRRYSERDD